jgi:hypothetical protein
MGAPVTDIDAPAKPVTLTKLRRGDGKPVSRWRRNAFGPAYADFSVREEELANLQAPQPRTRPNRFRRLDDPQPLPALESSRLVKRADVLAKPDKPFIAPIPKSRLMAGR